MALLRSLRLVLPRPVREFPFDLAVVVTIVALTIVATVMPVVRDTHLRLLVGLPFTLFVPGYAFIAALFPGTNESGGTRESEEVEVQTRINGFERLALSFGLSIAIVPLIGLLLSFTPFGIREPVIVVSLSVFSLVGASIAAVRRWNLPPDERFRVPYRKWMAAGRDELFEHESRVNTAVTVLLVLSLALAIGSVAYAVSSPQPGERFSAVYALTEENGELVADGYETEFVQGAGEEFVVGIDNHEHRSISYTVVIVEQEVAFAENETTPLEQRAVTELDVREQRELHRFEVDLDHGETWTETHEIAPTLLGENVHIAWLLYTDDVPEEPSLDNAAYYAEAWVTVTE